MRSIYYLIVAIFIFTGCTQQPQQVSNPKSTNQQKVTTNLYNNKNISIATTIVDSAIINNNDVVVENSNNQKLAILYSSKMIGHYAIDVSNTALAYMLHSKKSFELEMIDMKDESFESFTKTLNQLEEKNISKIVAVVTNESYEELIDVENLQSFQIYLPLIHKNNIEKSLPNIIYGGVDYKKQFEYLSNYSNGKDVEFYDNSLFGTTLNKQLDQVSDSLLYTQEVDDFSRFYVDFIKQHEKKLSQSTLFLDTPVVKSSILLSQLRANDIVTNRVLSTQINYTPLILSLTQTDDRKNLIVANSIAPVDAQLRESVFILNSDIVYDWLNYASLVGIDYFISDGKKLVEIVDNQAEYNIQLYKAKYYSFVKLK